VSHQSQLDFVASVKEKYPHYFKAKRVLEIGSLDINGSVRQFFEDCDYIGVDLGAGKGVDIIAKGEELTYDDGLFDVVISCECLEHNPEWVRTFANMVRMASGLVIMTCATTGRPEHGTRRTSPSDAPFCGDYYRNLTEQDIRDNCDLSKFAIHQFSTCNAPADLYFYGLCKQS
jgi:hypothetical protein